MCLSSVYYAGGTESLNTFQQKSNWMKSFRFACSSKAKILICNCFKQITFSFKISFNYLFIFYSGLFQGFNLSLEVSNTSIFYIFYVYVFKYLLDGKLEVCF